MVKTDSNPDGVPMDVFDMVREQTATNRSQFYYDFTLPFFGYNREGAEIKEAVRLNWWRHSIACCLAHFSGFPRWPSFDHSQCS